MKTIVVCLLLCALVYATKRTRMEKWATTSVQPHWEAIPFESNTQVKLSFYLKINNADKLKQIADSVSNPRSPMYGKYLTFAEVGKIVAPDAKYLNRVLDLLRVHGANESSIKVSKMRDVVRAVLPLENAEKIQCLYGRFKHKDTGMTVLRAPNGYSLPTEVAEGVDFVAGVIGFPNARNSIKSKKTRDSPRDTSTIHSIRKEYNITKSASTRTGQGSQAIASFLKEYFSQDDLDAFLKKFELLPNKPKVIGPNDPDTPGSEASLDIEYIIAVAENISTTFVYTPGEFEHQEPFLDWIQNMLDEGENCALVHSVSYGEYERDISEDYQERVDKDLQKFVATGRTVLVASGDYGAGCDEDKGIFKPVWPGGSPHITSVGATDGEKEKGVSFSGGGFSNVFGRPDWQKKQVDDYINVYGPKVDIPPAKWYNASGRGYPDIAAFGVDFEIIVGGEEDLVDGTSCSTPVIAGVISLLNEVRLKQGKPHLGFINPLLYSDLVPGLKDITEGRNAFDSCPGFPASEKWDPITGLGSPNVGNLIEILNK